MQHVIMAIHLMTVVALVTLVLYQKSEGGALGLGQSGFFSGRGQANALTRATGILATVFFVTSILLTVIPAWERRSIGGEDWTKAVEQEKVQIKEIKPEAAPQATETQIPKDKESIFEQLKRAQEQRQQGAGAPALRKSPEEPAQPAQRSEAPKAEEQKPVEAKPETESKAGPAKTEAPNAWTPPVAPPAAEVKPEAEPKVAPAKPEAPTVWTPPVAPPAAEVKPEAEPKVTPDKAEAPNAWTPPVAPPAARAEKPVPEPAPAPKSEAKPEDTKPAPEAAPAPAAPPPPVQWKSPTQ
jgi:protein translocase SecG subunit